MAENKNIIVPRGSFVALSTGAIAAARLYIFSGTVVLQATATNVTPSSQAGGLPMSAGQCLLPDLTLEMLFPGIGTGPLYLWGYGFGEVEVSISHA